MANNSKGFANIAILIVIFLAAAGVGYVVLMRTPEGPPAEPPLVGKPGGVEILAPRAGEELSGDTKTYTIRWSVDPAHAGKKVHLWLGNYFIGAADFDAGSYVWQFPDTYDEAFGNIYIDTSRPVRPPVQIGLFIFPPDRVVPPAFSPNYVQKYSYEIDKYGFPPDIPVVIAWSDSFTIRPMTIEGAQFIFPSGGERFPIGQPVTIRWQFPRNVSVRSVGIILDAGPSLPVGGAVYTPDYTKIFSPSGPLTFVWNVDKVLQAFGHEGTSYVDVQPGSYRLALVFRTPDGAHHRIQSNPFEIVRSLSLECKSDADCEYRQCRGCAYKNAPQDASRTQHAGEACFGGNPRFRDVCTCISGSCVYSQEDY